MCPLLFSPNMTFLSFFKIFSQWLTFSLIGRLMGASMKKKNIEGRRTVNQCFQKINSLLLVPMAQDEAGQEKPGTKVDLDL